ncbi:hypothetical protein ACFLU5_10850 [Bacteroidota bacterium]
MSYYSTTPISKYSYLWNKYRPAILRLMIDAAESPQEYKFSKHEFHNINPREKGGHSFTLRVFGGKAINDIKGSVVAKDLLEVLQQSKKASELVEISTYEFILDKQFLLHIRKEDTEE